MPRFSVEYKGQWACFSSIVDAFITPFMDKADYEAWRLVEYGRHGYQPAEKCNMKTIEEAVFSASLNRSHEETIEVLMESGIIEAEATELVDKYGDVDEERESEEN